MKDDKCPFRKEFGKWMECPHLSEIDSECYGVDHDAWCRDMIGKAMLAHKTWIGNDY